MHCMLALNECLLSVNLASITPLQCIKSNTRSISSFFSSRTPSTPAPSSRPTTSHARMCFTHHPSLLGYYHTLLLTNQPASLTQSCSHSSCASAVQRTSPAPHSSQPSITCPPSSTSLPSLHRAEQHSHQPPTPASIMILSCFGLCSHPHITTHAPTHHGMTVCRVLIMHDPLFMLKSARLACTSPGIIAQTHNPTLLSPCALIIELLLKIIAWQHAWTCLLAVCNHFPMLRFVVS
jgi:hypothetical protein